MNRFTSDLNRNLLYAISALPPAIFLVSGHAVLGLLFLACVVGGRFSRPLQKGNRDESHTSIPD